MPDSRPLAPADLQRDLAIVSIRSTIVDVPTVRRHKLSSLSVTAQSYVVVELRLANGVEGIGEAATLGGPRWSEERREHQVHDRRLFGTRLDWSPGRPVRGGPHAHG
jgi:muconate cycloisomerase